MKYPHEWLSEWAVWTSECIWAHRWASAPLSSALCRTGGETGLDPSDASTEELRCNPITRPAQREIRGLRRPQVESLPAAEPYCTHFYPGASSSHIHCCCAANKDTLVIGLLRRRSWWMKIKWMTQSRDGWVTIPYDRGIIYQSHHSITWRWGTHCYKYNNNKETYWTCWRLDEW